MEKTLEMGSQDLQHRGQGVVQMSIMAMVVVYKTILPSLRALQQHLTGLWHLESCDFSPKEAGCVLTLLCPYFALSSH